MPAEPTYTYSSNPATDDKDAVRALIMDTNYDGNGWMLSDEEILWLLSTEGGQFQSAAAACEMVAAKFTGPSRNIIIKRIGDLMKTSGGARGGGAAGDSWHALAATLRQRAARGAMPRAGGIDVEDRQDRNDSSLLQPAFFRGQDDIEIHDRPL